MNQQTDLQSELQKQAHSNIPFQSDSAFSRNLGWLTSLEAKILKSKRVAIAGLGGVGGHHLITLTRLGVGKFSIIDPDHFEVVNFNRQIGADLMSVGRSKTRVMAEAAQRICPDLEIRSFEGYLTAENIDQFLQGADLFVDGLDVSALKIRELVFKRAKELGIPSITVAPLGMGAATVAFHPRKMSFDQFFGFSLARNEYEKFQRLIVGLAPSLRILTASLVQKESVKGNQAAGPSTTMGCTLATSLLGTEALKILLGRGKVFYAPQTLYFDAYQGVGIQRRVWFGKLNPIFSLRLIFLKFFSRLTSKEKKTK